MRIAYLDHYAGSPTAGMEFRPHAMAVEWAKLGAHTTIIAGTFSHLRKVNFQDAAPGRPYDVDGVEFRFLRTREYDGNGGGRILSWVDYVGGGLAAASTMAETLRPDAVISSSTYPFDTWFAQRLAKAAGARLIHEVHDLWPLTPIELGGHSPKHPLMLAMAAAEKSAYRRSDAIVSILPNIEPHVRSLGIDTPVIAVPNGVDDAAEPQAAPSDYRALIDGLRERGHAVLGYAGGMTNANAMDDFVAAMGRLTQRPITAVLIGDGLYRAELEDQAKQLGANVIFYGSLPKPQIHDALSQLDALYIGSKRSPLYEYGVSANKIFDYMLTGVPIINAFASEHSPLVYAGASVRAQGGDVSDIARAIEEAVALTPEQRADMGRRTVAWVREHHSLPGLAARFLEVLRG